MHVIDHRALRRPIPAFAVAILAALVGCNPVPQTTAQSETRVDWDEQVLYHIFVRSFYDSDGDGHGDLEGIRRKLDYLQELGVTGILLTPLYPSPFYHNYFPDNFEGVDQEYGDLASYANLVRDLHGRGMKLIMDMEVQYVTGAHPWYRDAFGNPASPFTEYILFNDSANREPEPLYLGFLALPMYTGERIEVATLNFDSPELHGYMHGLFRYWVDPNSDGDVSDGVDGFRIDHIMDDLDSKGRQTGLFSRFWRPLFQELRQLNPDLFIVGEQADWGYGERVLEESDANAIFAIPLGFAIRSFDKDRLEGVLDTTFQVLPQDRHALVFAENHDMDRLASVAEEDPGRMRAAAALNLLLPGTPIVYYGQEIGMRGVRGEWGSDGNDIPIREAFEWHREMDGPGTALWYRESGPWWDESRLESADGLSVEEQRADTASLWHHYRRLIQLRKSVAALSGRTTAVLRHDDPHILAIKRRENETSVLIMVNLGSEPADFSLAEELQSHPHPLLTGSRCGGPAEARIRLPPRHVAVCGSAHVSASGYSEPAKHPTHDVR